MSDSDVLPKGGGAPLPPKRPTIIRAAQDGRNPVPAQGPPARPAPPPPGARPPPAVNNASAAGASGPVAARVPKRPSAPLPSAAPAKPPEDASKTNGKSRSQGSVRKRLEITIVDARPMSQAGFRDIPALNPATTAKSAQKPNDDDSSTKPLSSASCPPATASSPVTHSTPPPSQSPPPIPHTRPGATYNSPPASCQDPLSPPSQSETDSSSVPAKPTRPTILRPSRPKSAIITSEISSSELSRPQPPPPPIPKRSPVVTEASGQLISFDAPPKPARLAHPTEELQGGNRETKEEKVEGDDQAAPKKPTRVSIIRPPPPPPRPAVEKPAEANGGQQPGHAKPPSAAYYRPTAVVSAPPQTIPATGVLPPGDIARTDLTLPPVPAARARSHAKDLGTADLNPKHQEDLTVPAPVTVAAAPKDNPQSDTNQSGGIELTTRNSAPPVPPARPKVSPRDPQQTEEKCLETNLQSHVHDEPVDIDTQLSQTHGDKVPGTADRSKPPVPASRPRSLPPKPSPPAVASRSPRSHPSVLSKPLASQAALQDSEGSLYAVSEPLEHTDSLPRVPPSSENLPSRPPPPIPKSRPQHDLSPSPMLGRPLPAVPSTSPDASPSSEPLYQDVKAVENQAVYPEERPANDIQKSQPVGLSKDVSSACDKTEDDIESLYAKVNKPSKKTNVPGTSQIESAVPNPFGIKLKSVVSDDPQESKTESATQALTINDSDVKKFPVLPPKPRPAEKPKSFNKETVSPEAIGVSHEISTEPEPLKKSKPPVMSKRPTIIRPHAASRSDNTGALNKNKDSENIRMQEQSETSGREESNETAVKPLVPSHRPLVKRKSPVPFNEAFGDSLSGEEKSEMGHVSLEEKQSSHPQPQRPAAPAPTSRPLPPHPGKKPERPQFEGRLNSSPDLTDPRKSDSQSLPPNPLPPTSLPFTDEPTSSKGDIPWNAPIEPSLSKEDVPSEVEDGVLAASSQPGSTPPRREPNQAEGVEVKRRPPRPGAPPARPVSTPPARPPAVLKESSVSSSTVDSKVSPPARPARPAPSKEPESAAVPAIPQRPGLTHPLYGYMAQVPHAIADHHYPATLPDELLLQDGDTVVLLERVDDQWLKGQVGDKEGIFPENFVSIIHPLHDEFEPSAFEDDDIGEGFEDALQEKPDLLKGPRCRARFDFEGEGEGDLPFEDGDVIQLISRCGQDWFKGEFNGNAGMFPAAFVEILEDLPEDTEGQQDGTEGEHEVTAVFDFSGESGELSFEAGDKILVLSRVDEQWLYGMTGDCQGSFPSCFVDIVPANLPQYIPNTDSPLTAQPAMNLASGIKDEHQQWCTALHSFQSGQQGDLQFDEGDRIEVLEVVDQDWLKGKVHGQTGMFPANFVQMDFGEGSGLSLMGHRDLVKGKALFDFTGQNDGELTFQAGEEIVLGSMVSDDSEWQWGELNGKRGMFPASFVEMM